MSRWKQGSLGLSLLAVCGLIGLVGIAGCGDSSDSTTPTSSEAEATTSTEEGPPPVTKASYIEKGDAICERSAKKNQKIFDKRADLQDAAVASPSEQANLDVAKQIDLIADKRAELTKSLKGLEPPPTGPAKDYLAARKELEKAGRKSADAWRKGATAQITSEELTATQENEFDVVVPKNMKAAKKFGFEVCSQLTKDDKKKK